MKATAMERLGWNWTVRFEAIIESTPTTWSSTPQFCGPEQRGQAIGELHYLSHDIDYVFLDDSNLMFRKEEDALLVYMKYLP